MGRHPPSARTRCSCQANTPSNPAADVIDMNDLHHDASNRREPLTRSNMKIDKPRSGTAGYFSGCVARGVFLSSLQIPGWLSHGHVHMRSAQFVYTELGCHVGPSQGTAVSDEPPWSVKRMSFRTRRDQTSTVSDYGFPARTCVGKRPAPPQIGTINAGSPAASESGAQVAVRAPGRRHVGAFASRIRNRHAAVALG